MQSNIDAILCINGGSSSIKFALYGAGAILTPLLSGQIDNIGATATFSTENHNTHQKTENNIALKNAAQAAEYIIHWLSDNAPDTTIIAAGHRIVHGMYHTQPEKITDELLAELKTIIPVDPEHLPGELALIEIFKKHYTNIPHIACFDTAFHASMPALAKLLPLPKQYRDKGLQRYGFHGLSYMYLMEELASVAGSKQAHGKTILAHLGNGASLAAVNENKPVDTTMGFTPTGGLTMGTRTGDLDPGALLYLMRTENITASEMSKIVNHQSGILAISETTADMKKLRETKDTDPQAALAIDYFCYQTLKWIGAMSATLSGLDTLVFSGGIGQHDANVRRQICKGLNYMGVELDEAANSAHAALISTEASRVQVRVIKTNEELMIAKLTAAFIDNPTKY